jgi:hypothetical protein
MSANRPSLAFNLEHDVRVLSAMASNLTPYLYEQEIFAYLGADLPELTLGGLLMRLYRLSRLEDVLTTEQHNLVQDARLNFEAERSKWAVHYENKIQHELKSRASALLQFLDECLEDRTGCTVNYPVQAEKRIMIEHLRGEAQEHDILSEDQDNELKATDQKLRRLFTDGDFITDNLLTEVYPRERFWWLYGTIDER